jgi:hypothetical protein
LAVECVVFHEISPQIFDGLVARFLANEKLQSCRLQFFKLTILRQ